MRYLFRDPQDSFIRDIFVEDGPVTFQIVNPGTIRGAKKLISRDDFSYTLKIYSKDPDRPAFELFYSHNVALLIWHKIKL